jgi:hypothetical protein
MERLMGGAVEERWRSAVMSEGMLDVGLGRARTVTSRGGAAAGEAFSVATVVTVEPTNAERPASVRS